METPERYAAQLATYIASPTKIQSLTRLEFGTAPALHTIADMRLAVEHRDRHYKTARREFAEIQREAARERRAPVKVEIVEDAFTFVPPADAANPFLQPWRLTRALAESIATDFKVLPEHILGRARHRILIGARSVLVKLLIDRGVGFAEVGRRVGRDHSTIIHRYRQFETDCRLNERVAASYQRHLGLLEEANRELATLRQDNEAEAVAA